jgi:hypothetical protein
MPQTDEAELKSLNRQGAKNEKFLRVLNQEYLLFSAASASSAVKGFDNT